jgi:hypothetical protein
MLTWRNLILASPALLAIMGGAHQQKDATPPTYAKDIAPILNARCITCHSETKIAPFSLIGYENAKKWAPTIADVTASGYMPPWKAKAGYGDFKNNPSLTTEQKALVDRWAKAGAPEGSPADIPAAPAMTAGWRMGAPDMIITPDMPTKISAEGPDFFRDYLVDPHITAPTWVRIVDFRPLQQGTVHHIIPNLVSKEEAEKCAKIKFDHDDHSWEQKSVEDIDTYSKLGFWSTGAPPFVSPDGTAFLIKPGDQFLLDVHYKCKGKPESEQVQVALYFQKEPPKDEMKVRVITGDGIYLQPGEKNVRVYGIGNKLEKEATVYAVWPHMHYDGRTFKAWVKYPGGYSKPLVCIDDWDPEWQLLYYLKSPMILPVGSQVFVTGTYDNSADNPRNPHNPPRVVTSGDSSKDEMLFFELFQVVKKDAEEKKTP